MNSKLIFLVIICLIGLSIGNVGAQEINQTRLAHIRLLHTTYPPIELPFNFNRLSPLPITSFDANYGIDKLVFGDEAPCSIVGIVPDTTHYFGFFYLKAADSELPSFISYDKTGELINNVLLFETCWQGCSSDCIAQLEIDLELNIQLQFEEYGYECAYSDFDQDFDGYFPIEASKISGYRNYSKISESGEVIDLRREILSAEELQQCEKIQQLRRSEMNH